MTQSGHRIRPTFSFIYPSRRKLTLESGGILIVKKLSLLLLFSLLPLSPYSRVQSEELWSPEQSEILVLMQQLSATTALNGAGADAYGEVLADGFSRWTTGSTVINHKEEWVEGVRSWFDDGWRVIDRNQTVLEITIKGDNAFTRRIVEETFRGPDDEISISKAGLAETWIRSDSNWLLSRVSVDVLDSQ